MNAPDERPLRPGTLPALDEAFELQGILGEGAAGTVYAATQRGLERSVAIKRWHPRGDAARFERFAEEASLMARVAHPSIVPVLCHGTIEGDPVLVMERVQGADLAQGMEAMRGVEPPQLAARWSSWLRSADSAQAAPWSDSTPWWRIATRWIAQLARALDHAHACGVLHRDIKPSNVLVASNGSVFLSDFSVAEDLRTAELGLHRGTTSRIPHDRQPGLQRSRNPAGPAGIPGQRPVLLGRLGQRVGIS